MRIEYSEHAQVRMASRDVSEADVRETLESPDAIWPGEVGAEEIAVRRYGNRDVRVVYEELATDHVLVITVMKPKIYSAEREK